MANKPDEPGKIEADADSERLAKVFDRAIANFDEDALPQIEIRAQALLARRFASIPGAQWEGDWGETFENSVKMEINKVALGLDKIQRDFRANRIVPDFRPAGGDSDQDTADTLDGLHRADSYHFKAQQARDNAVEEGLAGGFGAYRLTNEWEDPYDKDSDAQRINPALIIVDADQRVFFDANSKLYDKSDSKRAHVLTAMTPDAFKDKFGEDCPTSWPDMQLRRSQWDWFRPDMILISEYYEVEEHDEKLWILEHRLTTDEERIWSSDISQADLEDRKAMGWQVRSQKRKRVRIHKYVMSGERVLEDHGFIAGPRIPIVPFYYKRWYIDNVERFSGYVQRKMDAQRIYNAKVSKLAEIDATSPGETPIFDPEQITPNLENLWVRANVDRPAYLLAHSLRQPDGTIIQTGPLGYRKQPDVPPVTALLLQASAGDLSDDMQEADQVMSNTSAEAMDIAATRIDAKSDVALDNWRQSVQCEGEIYLGMAQEVYVEEGRTVETMSEDGDDGEATLQEAFTDDKGAFRLRNDFTRGKYKVIADVTEATSTRRDKTVKSMLGLAEVCVSANDIEGAQAAIITAGLNMDGEGMADFQNWNRQRALKMGLVEPNEEEKAQLAQEAQMAASQPDPAAQALLAQAEELQTRAGKNIAQTAETNSKTALNEARVVETLSGVGVSQEDAATRRFTAMQPKQPANDTQMDRPRIRRGNEL